MGRVFFSLMLVALNSRGLAFVGFKRANVCLEKGRRLSIVDGYESARKQVSRHLANSDQTQNLDSPGRKSVTGIIYAADETDIPVVKLFTKDGCTLCDKVKEVLRSLREELPHTLEAVDITDEQNVEFLSKYKWDIPVLWIGNKYWAKHRLDEAEAREGLRDAQQGIFDGKPGEPDSSQYD